jgi:hypothetical protein
MNLLRKKPQKLLTISIILISLLLNINIIQSTNIDYNNKINNTSDENNIYDLLIISPNKFSKYIQPLVIHKNKHDIKTKQVDIEEVYDQMFWQGRDKAEKLKYFIKKAIEEWNIKYVLLIGGRKTQGYQETWWIPVRYSFLNRNYEKMPENRFLTDLYYADIYDKHGNFSTWDDNNNKIFGEWPLDQPAADIPDLYPEISVGRLPCRNIKDVKIIVKKIINYETGNCSDSWFKKMMVIAGDTYPKKTPGFIDGEYHTQLALDNMTDFTPVKLWISDGSLNNWMDILKSFNKGAGFVFFSGHGGPHVWSTFYPETKKKTANIYLRHMSFFFNKNKLPVVLSASGCFNNMFNVSITKSDWTYLPLPKIISSVISDVFKIKISSIKITVPHCWGEKLVFNPHGGSIAVIASTAFSYESSDINTSVGGCEWLDIRFFEEYGKKKTEILGELWSNTITAFLQNYTVDWSDSKPDGDALIIKNVEQWLLMGDPSLKIGGYN